MIKDFSFLKGELIIPLALGYRCSIFENVDDNLANKFVNTASIQVVKWINDNKEIQIDRSFFAYPSIDMHYVIAMYSQIDPVYPSPNNAVIYTANGSLHKILTPPKLISKLAFERLGENNPPQPYAPDSLFFNHVNWDKDSKGNLVTSVWIGYDREWHENRVLNPETGEFGECIGSGRL